MKKHTTKVAILIMVIVVGIVGFYAYLSTRHRNAMAEAELTAVQMVLSRDLQRDYPSTVKQVVSYFTEIQECFYNEQCTDDEIEKLGMKARELYDKDLQDNNEVTTYLVRLKAEINSFRSAKRTISRISLASSNNVETFKQDGYEFARINCSYYFSENGIVGYQDLVYLLRRDENRRWKIYGWETAAEAEAAK